MSLAASAVAVPGVDGAAMKKPGRGGGGGGGGKKAGGDKDRFKGSRGSGGRSRPATRARHSTLLTPTDQEDTERALNRTLQCMGLYASKTIGDGNCMFRALSDQLYGHDRSHAAIRQSICDHLAGDPERYEGFADIEKSFDEYVAIMRENRTYGGHLELTAFARLKKRSIKVILPDYVYVIAGRDESPTPLEAEAQGQSKRDGVDDDEELESAGMLYLSYHIFEHYSSVRNLKGPHVGLPRVIEQPIDTDILNQPGSSSSSSSKKKPAPAIDSKMEELVFSSLPPHITPSATKVRHMLEASKGDFGKVVDILVEEDAAAEAAAEACIDKGLIAHDSASEGSGSPIHGLTAIATIQDKESLTRPDPTSLPAFLRYRGTSPFATSDDVETSTSASDGLATPVEGSSIGSPGTTHSSVHDPSPQPSVPSVLGTRKRPLNANSHARADHPSKSDHPSTATALISPRPVVGKALGRRLPKHIQPELRGKAKREARKNRMERSRREQIEADAWGAVGPEANGGKRMTRGMVKSGTTETGLSTTAKAIKELYI